MTVKTESNNKQLHTPFKVVALKDESLERKLTMSFGFMSVIPILIIVWAMVYNADLRLVIYLVVASVIVGYFFIARRSYFRSHH